MEGAKARRSTSIFESVIFLPKIPELVETAHHSPAPPSPQTAPSQKLQNIAEIHRRPSLPSSVSIEAAAYGTSGGWRMGE